LRFFVSDEESPLINPFFANEFENNPKLLSSQSCDLEGIRFYNNEGAAVPVHR